MDYKGGTYISQVNASSVKTACKKWAENLKVSRIVGFGTKSKEILINEIEHEEPVSINNLINVWCVSALIRGKLALVTFIRTESINNANPKSEI
jgi:DNA polymerase/3'-5' exonuclease PolX